MIFCVVLISVTGCAGSDSTRNLNTKKQVIFAADDSLYGNNAPAGVKPAAGIENENPKTGNTGPGETESDRNDNSGNVETENESASGVETKNDKVSSTGSETEAVKNASASAGNAKKGNGVDVDLTIMSSTMVYAEVYDILFNPDDYIGKTIKMNGPYVPLFYDETGLYYHYVLIEDAAACCQNGMEFIWSGDHTFPNDYPDEQARIEISGVFGSYEELGMTYYYLSVDDICVL
jgi:hypothetical protein